MHGDAEGAGADAPAAVEPGGDGQSGVAPLGATADAAAQTLPGPARWPGVSLRAGLRRARSGGRIRGDRRRSRNPATLANRVVRRMTERLSSKGTGSKNGKDDGDSGTIVVTRPKTKTKRPNMYRVLLLNDDYTPMEFVVHVLERFFNKSREEATRVMLHVHHHGVGECGVYTYEVAETKVTQVMDFARKHQHPLQCVMEKK